jgi:preprotein translocase subunit SecA
MLSREDIATAISDAALAHFDAMVAHGMTEEDIDKAFIEAGLKESHPPVVSKEAEATETDLDRRDIIKKAADRAALNPLARNQLLGVLDMLWMNNLDDLESLSQSVGLRAYGQHDPLVEYRQEAHRLFKSFWTNYNAWIFMNVFKLTIGAGNAIERSQPKILAAAGGTANDHRFDNVGRNDPCPCGSGRKFKHCGLQNTDEHQRFMAQKGPKHEVTGE